MKKLLFILFISILTFSCWSNPYELLMPDTHISIQSSYMITDNNYTRLGDVSVRSVEPIILFTSFPTSDDFSRVFDDSISDNEKIKMIQKRALFKEAMKSLKEKAIIEYGENVGLINITMDKLIETPSYFGLPILALIYYNKVIVLSADVIKFNENEK